VQPLLVPVVVAGTVWLWRSERFRALAWSAILVELLFFVVGGKSYYPAPIYPLLYAAGAVWVEQSVRSKALWRGWTAVTVLTSLALLPIGLPVLPPGVMADSGIWKARKDFADMYGWPDLAEEVAAAYRSLPGSERSGTLLLAQNYGEAGALDLYGPALGLPPVVSPHLTFYYWASAGLAPQTVIAVGYGEEDLAPLFADITPAGTISNSFGIANEEHGRPIYICRSPRLPLAKAWPSLKRLD